MQGGERGRVVGWMLTGGHSRSGGSKILRPKSRFRSDFVSCWTDSGLLKSSWPFDFKL